MRGIDIKSILLFLFIIFWNAIIAMSVIGGIHHFLMSIGAIK